MLDEYQQLNMDHTRCCSRSCNWVPFSVLCGLIRYNHSADVVPAHLALILDVPGRWAILENTHSYHFSPGVCGYCHDPQQKWGVKLTHSSVPIVVMWIVNSSGWQTGLSSSTIIMNHNFGYNQLSCQIKMILLYFRLNSFQVKFFFF